MGQKIHLTKDQVDEIYKLFTSKAVKDSDFPATNSISAEDQITILQNALNKRIAYSVILQAILDRVAQGIDGKGLSTEDFTTELKNKLIGIESGAEVNILEGVKVNGVDLVIDNNKKVNVLVPDVSQFITKSVDDLVNYYLKNEVYDKDEIDELMAASQNFHYEVYLNRQMVRNPASNVLYLIGPMPAEEGKPEKVDAYQEWIYYRGQWKQIGEASLDLSDYITTEALAETLNDYQEKLVSGTNIKTINGQSIVGSGNLAVGDLNAVKFTSQTLTDVQKTQARTNIGAGIGNGTYSKPDGGIPKTDLASGVQSSLDLADSSVQANPVGSVTPAVDPYDYATREELSQLGQKVTEINPTRESPTVAVTEGKFISRYGVYSSANGFQLTDPILIPKNTGIILRATGYLTNTAMIAKYDGEIYTPLAISLDSSEHIYKYYNDTGNDLSVVLSYSSTQPHSIIKDDTVIAKGVASIANEIASVNQKTDGISNKAFGGVYAPTLGTLYTGKYIAAYGVVTDSQAFSISTPFYVPKGSTITVIAAGYSTAVAMISRYVKESQQFYPVVMSTDANVNTYSTTAQNAGYYVMCYNHSLTHSVSISNIQDIWEDFGDLGNAVNGEKIQFITKHAIALNVGIGGQVNTSSPAWNGSYRYSIVSCQEGDLFIINGYGQDTERLFGFVDQYNNLISAAVKNTTGVNYVVKAPKDAAFIIINDKKQTSDSWKVGAAQYMRLDSGKIYENIFATFQNIVAIGDSLTEGAVYTSATTSRVAIVPYPVELARLSGGTLTTLARSGADASYIWANYGSQIVQKTNAIAIIYIGTNSGLTDTVSTDAEGTDPANWANNNTGDYCRIVDKCLSCGYKVLLLRPFTSSGNLQDTISAINDIAQKFNVAVLDSPSVVETKYHLWPDGNGNNYTHLNDIGYVVFAQRLIYYASHICDDMFIRLLSN